MSKILLKLKTIKVAWGNKGLGINDFNKRGAPQHFLYIKFVHGSFFHFQMSGSSELIFPEYQSFPYKLTCTTKNIL